MKFRPSERGVALITTLIMLALVTSMSVAFLALTRREKGSVTNTERLSTSGQLAQMAFNRAQVEVASRMISSGNRHAYDLLVSTNYSNGGFISGDTTTINANYTYSSGFALSMADQVQNIANLFYDPRPPVYVDTNASGTTGPLDFRFYNDLNRNRRFEATGVFDEYDNFNNNLGPRPFTGDPQWVGALERPESRHSGNNLFLGRYAFMALPAGKSLDLNWIHNQAKYIAPNLEGYVRNHGYLPSEMNLAAFLVGLNTNAWPLNSYVYQPGLLLASGGTAFQDALALSYYRANSNYFSLSNISHLFGPVGTTELSINLLDDYGDGFTDANGNRFLMTGTSLPTVLGRDDNVLPGSIPPWFGSPKPRPYFDIMSDLFRTGRAYAPMVARMTSRMNVPPGHYDRYTFYRLAAQLAADSELDRTTHQIHLNYNNLTYGRFRADVDVNGSTDTIFVPDFSVNNGQLVTFTEELFPGGTVTPSGGLPQFVSRRITYRAFNVTYVPAGVTFQITLDGVNALDINAGPAGTYSYVYSLTAPFDANRQTDFIPWEPVQFFGSVANALLKQHHGLSIDGQGPNIQLYPNNNFTADVRRTLQLAANIYEATRGARYPEWNSTVQYPDVANGNNRFVLCSGISYEAVGSPPPGQEPASLIGASPGWNYLPVYPSVFRPLYANIGGEIYITGFQHETNALFLQNYFVDIKDPAQLPLVGTDVNIYGVSPIIATRKGMPSFNEFTLETIATLTRKLEFYKNQTNGPIVATNQMLILSITNAVGIEGWNSYLHSFPSNVILLVTNNFSAAIATNTLQSNIYAYGPSNTTLTDLNLIRYTNGAAALASPWQPLGFKLFRGGEPTMLAGQYVERYGFNASLSNYFTNILTPAGVGAFQRSSGFPVPSWYLNATNRFVYAAIQGPSLAAGHVLDMVTLDDMNVSIDLTQALLNDTAQAAGLPNMWLTNRFNNADITIAPEGVTNQIMVSLGVPRLSPTLWQRYSAPSGIQNVDFQINKFRSFMGLTPYPPYNRARIPPTTNAAAPFAPTRKYYDIKRWSVNDPAVHFNTTDLSRPVVDQLYNAYPPNTATYWQFTRANYGKPVEQRITPYSPWGGKRDPATLLTAFDQGVTNVPPPTLDPLDYDMSIKDSLVRRSDDWAFPDGKIGNVGWLGRVHRGTPWQTIYMKAVPANANSWNTWMGQGRLGSHPTNDWGLFDMFTIAVDANARRSLLSVNQTNEAAWAAALGGVLVLSNSTDYVFNPPATAPAYDDLQIIPFNPNDPASYAFKTIHNAIVNRRNNLNNQTLPQVFTNIGQILAVPELSVGPIVGATLNSEVLPSPFINIGFPVNPDPWSPEQKYGIPDAVYERIPQQIMSLLTVEDYPRVAIYAYGQALEPAARSRVLTPGNFYRLCTNYAIKGEVVSKSMVRFEGINPSLGFNTTNNVDIANDTIGINQVVFRLRHTQRNWGNIWNTPVVFRPVPEAGVATALPAPLVYGRTYYIVNHGVDFIRLALTPGGTPIDLTDTGVGINAVTTIPKAVVERYNLIQPD